jgi:alanyl-tRNA synthetase
MKSTAELREGFQAFFEEKGHLRVPSASLIPPPGDTSTLLISAGMQPQMPYFLGRSQPPAPLTTTTQKVFRTVDIDVVGLDTYHLTFFEMLGNFSFGQYFKEGAIAYAREFLVDRLGLDWNRLWASVHAGDPELELGPDEVSIGFWEKAGLPAERIVPLPSSENFWSVGGPGPCGPDSEIYYDWGEEVGCPEGCLPGCDRCERFLEVWNLVFMEYELGADGKLSPLPEQNIDTGMGLERIARVVQQVPSLYDTDGYRKIMGWIEGSSGTAPDASPDATKAHRVLADHARGMTFIVAEGISPSNEGRGYVLRRIIRRAVQHGLRIELKAPFLAGLADVVIEEMGEAYPEIAVHRDDIARVLTAEEERFGQTLENGMEIFEERAGSGEITADAAFELHATYGFPIELTEELAREKGIPVDVDGFREHMGEHREISRRGMKGAAEVKLISTRPTEFVGFEKTEVLTAILELAPLEDGLFQAKLEQSPFYPEGGGQVSDAGWIGNEAGARAELVSAARLDGDQVLTFRGEGFSEGERVRAVVPWAHRFPTMANHTATHLLHRALQEVLGDHVRQAGSAVRPDKLRFDFTHPQAVTEDERVRIEQLVNEKVFENLPVHAFVTTIDEARELGAMMLFGEKYGEEVRIIEIPGFSRELCGGTHVRWTAEIGPFVILGESSVGAGTRRIEAVTAGEAYALLHERARQSDELRAELGKARKEKKEAGGSPEFEVRHRDDGLVVVEVSALGGATLRDLSDAVRRQEDASVALLGFAAEGRVQLVVSVDEGLADQVSAVDAVRAAAAVVGGGGGGKPTLAEAGGKQPEKLSEALDAGREAILARLL